MIYVVSDIVSTETGRLEKEKLDLKKKYDKLVAKKLPYQYHVVYTFKKATGETGNGSMTINRYKAVESADDVTSMLDFVKKENDFEEAVITNFMRLKRVWL